MQNKTPDTKDRNLRVEEFEAGDIFSESSHYILQEKPTGLARLYKFKHVESGEIIQLDEKYVSQLLKTADQYHETRKVGKEDKFWTKKQVDEWIVNNPVGVTSMNVPIVGDLRVQGIRTIWEGIHSSQVFAVCYKKADVALSASALKKLQDAQVKEAVDAIEAVKVAKKGVANTAAAIIAKVQQNPILPYEVGEQRILRGYKVQFDSRDGKYNCFDMDYPDGPDGANIRPVNIVTLQWIVYNGVKYDLE